METPSLFIFIILRRERTSVTVLGDEIIPKWGLLKKCLLPEGGFLLLRRKLGLTQMKCRGGG